MYFVLYFTVLLGFLWDFSKLSVSVLTMCDELKQLHCVSKKASPTFSTVTW